MDESFQISMKKDQEAKRNASIVIVVVFLLLLAITVGSVVDEEADRVQQDYNDVVNACSYNPYSDDCQYELKRARILRNSQ